MFFSSLLYNLSFLIDPNTTKWLQRNLDKVFGYPEIVRFSWSSCSRILDELAFAVDWNEPIEEEITTSKYKTKRPANQTTFKSSTPKKSEKIKKNYLNSFKCKIISEL